MPMRCVGVFLLAVLAIPLPAQQLRYAENIPGYYHKLYHIGTALGTNNMDFMLRRVPDFNRSDSLRTVLTRSETGISILFSTEWRLQQLIVLRFEPGLLLGQRDIEYHFETKKDTFDIIKQPESALLYFPLTARLRSKRYGNFAAYMSAGGQYTYDLGSQKDVRNNIAGKEIIKLYKHDFGMQVGTGLDFFLPYFKLGFDLRVMLGLRDRLVHDQTIYARAISSLRSKAILFTVTFEG